jgi:hypothetical protein
MLNSVGTDVLDPPMTQTDVNLGTTPVQSTWQASTPVTEAEMPLGTYTMTADGTDQGGTSVTAVGIGDYHFVSRPVITISADHTVISLDAPTATITGNVQVQNPDGSSAPYQGVILVEESWLGGGYGTTTTDANGDYSYTVTPDYPGSFVGVHVQDTTVAAADSADILFTTRSSAAQINAKLSATKISYGAKATVSGTLSYQSAAAGGAYRPAANRPVRVSSYPGDRVVSGQTDSAGKFTLTLPTSVSATWSIQVGGAIGDYLLNNRILGLPMQVNLPTAITKFHASLDRYWRVSLSGCLALAKPIQYATPPVATALTIQYSVGTPNGPWRTLTKNLTLGLPCGTQGVWFSRTVTAPANLVYYRAYYPGASGYLATTSGKSLAWKYADRITNFSVSPTVVASNGDITVKGQLQYYASSAWHNYGGQVVYIVFRQKGTSAWYWIVKVTTNSAGRFAATVPVAGIGSATWSAEFEGNSTHLATAPPGVYVRVTG